MRYQGEMGRARTHYELLQVSPAAGAEVIAAARRTLLAALKKHPDLGGDAAEAARINEAADTLLDPKRRAAYDAALAKGEAAPAPRADAAFVERRRAPRHAIDATVSFCLVHDLCWHPARVVDVSILGLRLKTHAPLMTGQHLVIAASNLASPAIHGTVQWTRMFHPSIFERVYEAGVEFSDQIPDVDQRLTV